MFIGDSFPLSNNLIAVFPNLPSVTFKRGAEPEDLHLQTMTLATKLSRLVPPTKP